MIFQDNHSVRDYAKKVDLMESKGVPCISFGKDTCVETLSPLEMVTCVSFWIEHNSSL